jgi:hypothetical protein
VFLVHAYPELDNVPLLFFHAVSQSSWHSFAAGAPDMNIAIMPKISIIFLIYPPFA